MAANIPLTGVSGYLGGTLLNEWKASGPTNHGTIYALVRSDEQAKQVQNYGIEPLLVNLKDEQAIVDAIVQCNIAVVFYLIGSYWMESQLYFIKGLAEVKAKTGEDVHFLYTTSTKQFADTAGCPTDRPIYDNEPNLYDIQKNQSGHNEELSTAVKTNCAIIDEGEKRGVRVYLFSLVLFVGGETSLPSPDGKGTGFGNKLSIQTVDIVSAFQSLGHAYNIQKGRPEWAVCSLEDTTSLYFFLLRQILDKKDLPHGKEGYYLASPGLVAWEDIYAAIAEALYERGVIDSPELTFADDAVLEKMAPALGVDGKSSALGKIGGKSTYTPRHAEEIGWKPKHRPDHILEAVDAEVEIILANMSDSLKKIR